MKVGKLPSEKAKLENSVQPAKGKWGLQLHELNPQIAHQLGIKADQGVAVVGVEPGSPADEAGIRQGDIIVEVDRHPVNSLTELREKIDKSEDKDHLLLLVQRENGKFYVPLEQQG